MRTFDALGLLLMLGGCGSKSPTVVPTQSSIAEKDDTIRVACAHGGEAVARDCVVEQTRTPVGLILTLRHPDGAFRRLRVTTDGRGVVPADGAQPAVVTIQGTDIAVAIGDDRYLLPATIRAGR